MNIQILSDLHLEFESLEIDTSNADVVVLAGDIHIGDKGIHWTLENITDKPVIYVLGNHEYYKQAHPKLISQLRELCDGTNIHLLENDSALIKGIEFFGCTLWTDFELFGDPRVAGYQCQQVMTDFKKIKKSPGYSKLRSIDVAMINKQSQRWLTQALAQSTATKKVVVSHHAPSLLSVPEQYQSDIVSAAYASNSDALVANSGAALWIHGHMHEPCDYHIGQTRVVCNPRGYPGERNSYFDPGFSISI